MTNTLRNERGSALILALLVLTGISLFGISLALTTITDRNIAKFDRESMEALHAAESGIARAKRAIQDRGVTFGDADGDGLPDFQMTDSLSWGGAFEVFGESDIPSSGSAGGYAADIIRITAVGRSKGAYRSVLSEIRHDSFLKYARFVQATGVSYGCGAVLSGEVYSGGTIGLPSGCSSTEKVTFLEMVAAVSGISNLSEGIFHKGYNDSATVVDLQASVDFDLIREKADGSCAECECDGFGRKGIYMDDDPLGIGTNGTINLSLFDFQFEDPGSGDTVVTYNGAFVMDPTTGNPLLRDDYNGIIFFEGDGFVRGTSDGVGGRALTIWATDDIFVEGDIITGYTGFDPVTRLPDGTGFPVNIGLVASDYIYIGAVNRIAQIDAVLMAVNSNWRVWDTALAAHPPAPIGNYDLDQDGIVGESPVNHDPNVGTGWDEVITAGNRNDTWVLNINGPIITYDGGSAYPWNAGSVLSAATGPTRRYNYDLDVTDYPPPCFPVPLNLWVDHAWAEIYDVEN